MESSAQAQGVPRVATLGAYRPALAVITGVSVLGAITALTGLRRRARGLAPARTEVFVPAGTDLGAVRLADSPAAAEVADAQPATALSPAAPGSIAGDCWDDGGECWDLVDA